MKRTFTISMTLVIFSIFIVGAEAFGAKSLYDDFSVIYIDSQKWEKREFVREVVEGKLVSKIGNTSGTGSFRNRTQFQNPGSINTIECKLTVAATNLDTGNSPLSTARILGFFYNTQATGRATGDVLAAFYIGDRGSGLEAFWWVGEALDDDLTNFEEKGSGTLIDPGTLNYGTAYTAKIEYDGANQFTFTVDGVSYTFATGPARQQAAVTEFKALATRIVSDGGSGIGYVSALFDDVYTDGTLYDDFSTAPLDQTKWQDLEFVREISSGKIRLNVQAEGSRTDATLKPNDQTTAYLETKVLIESGSQVSTGARGIARIAGWYYNDSRGPGSGHDYNEYEGDVWVSNQISLDDSNNLTAYCSLSRMDTYDTWGPSTSLFYQEFATPAFDTSYTLSIEFTGLAVIFKCNNEIYQYDITTPTYPPYEGQHRQLRSRVYADPGESGYIKANFDDVYTGYTAQATYDASGTWDITQTDVEDSCDSDAQPETFTATITQTGNDFTAVDDDGETFTGTVSGAYYTMYGENSVQRGTSKNYITFILSSGTSGSGSEDWTWTDGIDWCEGSFLFTLSKQLDNIPPTVSSVYPANNTVDLAVTTTITATFSKAMDSSTITTDTFLVNGSGNISGTVTYSGTTATFTPTTNLDYGKTYTATITTGAKDSAGNALQTDYTWSFTTQSGSSNGDGDGDGDGGGGGCFITTLLEN